MARITTYDLDQELQLLDKVIGSDATDNSTRNYTLQQIADFFSSRGLGEITKIGLPYRFDAMRPSDANRFNGSLSVPADTTAIDNTLTSIAVNENNINGTNVRVLLDAFVGGVIKIQGAALEQEGNYALYNLDSVSQLQDGGVDVPGFVLLTLRFVSGNSGSLFRNGEVYSIATLGSGGGSGTDTRTDFTVGTTTINDPISLTFQEGANLVLTGTDNGQATLTIPTGSVPTPTMFGVSYQSQDIGLGTAERTVNPTPNMAGFTISGAALTGAPITVGGSAVTIADNGVITIAANPTSVASQTITVTGNFVEDADASNTGTFTATIFIRTHTIHYVVLASTMATDFVTPADSDIQTDRLVSGGTITLQNSASNNFARLYLDDTTFTPNIDAQGEATTPHFESQGFLILPDAFTSSIGGRSFTQYEFRSARPVTLTITNR